jgi:hypothetical protein
MILVIVPEFTVKIRPCSQLDCLMFLEKPWSSYTVQNVWMFTLQNLLDTIIQMVHTLEPDSHTCFSWFIPNIVLSVLSTSLFHVCTDSKFIHWLTNFSPKQHPTSKHTPRIRKGAVVPVVEQGLDVGTNQSASWRAAQADYRACALPLPFQTPWAPALGGLGGTLVWPGGARLP